jgi:transposase
LALEALQHVRIKLRWQEIDKENEAIECCKKERKKYRSIVHQNGDSPKQLLARGRYILFKKESSWTYKQAERAKILFREYPILKQAYKHVMKFRNIYKRTNSFQEKKEFEDWIKESKEHEIKEFNTAANSIEYHLKNILNFFDNRSTNANA